MERPAGSQHINDFLTETFDRFFIAKRNHLLQLDLLLSKSMFAFSMLNAQSSLNLLY